MHNKKIIFGIVIFLTFMCGIKAVDQEKITYVLSKYEHTMHKRQYLFYPAKKPKKLLIFFTGLLKNRYIMWSWFWRDREDWDDTAYLFLKDDDACWYLGNQEKSFVQDYSAIIDHHVSVSKLRKENVFTIGGSMGGYAAIFYATKLGLKAAIAINPQVSRAIQARRGFNDIGDKWQDLDQVLAQAGKVPDISLVYSYNSRDQAGGHALLDVLKQKGSLVIMRRHDSPNHSGGAHLTKEFVESEISYLEKQGSYETISTRMPIDDF